CARMLWLLQWGLDYW
nr:immunoglobulin heavy chain junction region [Macaca mulatta]